ncbi:MAG: hypothetical protein AAB381_01795 [Patescibacteria group bacterium]
MTITTEELQATAPAVPAKAQQMSGLKNPFISLQSLESLCQGNETLEECLRDMVTYSLRYAETVCRFEQIVARGQDSNQDGAREEIERVRSTIHDSTIDAIKILSRTMRTHGKDNGWISKMHTIGRAGYGKFAILIAFEVVLGKV